MKIKIKDSKTLKDSIDALKKKIMDAEVDLTRPGIISIANALAEKKEAINETQSFEELRDLMREAVKKFDTPKSKEILIKIDELDRLYQRDPRKGSHNDYWLWERLLKYCYNIILKASGNPSPDVKENVKDSCAKDEEDDVLALARLLGEAHDKVMEAQDLVKDLIEANLVGQDLEYELDDLESAVSEFEFMGESDPRAALLEKFPPVDQEDTIDIDWE